MQSDLLGEVTARILGIVGKQRLTYCHSGGEAVETAIRIARTVTARDKVVYFTDDVHGRADIVLGRGVGTGLAARTVPLVAGVPQHVVEDAFVLEYGSPEAMDVISAHGEQDRCSPRRAGEDTEPGPSAAGFPATAPAGGRPRPVPRHLRRVRDRVSRARSWCAGAVEPQGGPDRHTARCSVVACRWEWWRVTRS